MSVQTNPSTHPQQDRCDWVDNAKAIGIVLVVLGHAQSLSAEAFWFIYRFHMPLFFFLGGYLINRKHLSSTSLQWVKKASKSLMVPYLGWWLVSFLWWLAIRHIGEKAAESAGLQWWQPLWGLAWGTGAELWVNVPLWFFPSLFVTSCCGILIILWTKHNQGRLVGSCIVTAFLTLIWPIVPTPGWWFNFDLLPWTLFFYLGGHLFHSVEDHVRKLNVLWRSTLVVAATLACWACVKIGLAGSEYVGLVNLSVRNFDPVRILYFPPALLMILAIFSLSDKLPRSAISSMLARESIIIFPAHSLCCSLLTGIISVVFGVSGWNTTGGWPSVLVYTTIGLALPVVASPFIRKYMPFLAGYRK